MTDRIPSDVRAHVARLFVEESQVVFNAALRAACGDRSTAEVAVQEAFQAAAIQWAKIADRSPDGKRAWLCRVAKNKAIDRYRVGKPMHLVADVDVLRLAPSAEEVALTRIEKDRCLQVIKEMPLIQRTVVYLLCHDDWTVKEVAEELGIATSTVRVHLYNARVMLKAALGYEVSLAHGPDDADDDPGREKAR
jgi:RNA polymerase sigma factor (sigma-70 family)